MTDGMYSMICLVFVIVIAVLDIITNEVIPSKMHFAVTAEQIAKYKFYQKICRIASWVLILGALIFTIAAFVYMRE